MRWFIVLSIFNMAGDLVEKALGISPQYLFSASAVWLWWFPVVLCVAVGACIAVRGVSV